MFKKLSIVSIIGAIVLAVIFITSHSSIYLASAISCVFLAIVFGILQSMKDTIEEHDRKLLSQKQDIDKLSTENANLRKDIENLKFSVKLLKDKDKAE